ncbi:MAG: hypothetical protein EOP06_24100 [Proteobacteria bacterium]|nr:MAG: hypothetical protein EOP06_24100 [Pseudomonadota bacterium]
MFPSLKRPENELKSLFLKMSSISDLANILEIPEQTLRYFVYRQPIVYKQFQIPKKNGSLRNISAPPKSIKLIQSKLNSILHSCGLFDVAAHGFVRGNGIKSNAGLHVRRNIILNIDLENFFPKINFGRVRGLFMNYPFHLPASIATALARLSCDGNTLPQGAPQGTPLPVGWGTHSTAAMVSAAEALAST